MKRWRSWFVFLVAAIICSTIGPGLIFLHNHFGYSYKLDGPFFLRYETIRILCTSWIFGVVEYNSGESAAFFAICVAHTLAGLVTSTLLLAPARLPWGFAIAFVLATAVVYAREFLLFGAPPLGSAWLAVLIAAALYWAPVAVKATTARY